MQWQLQEAKNKLSQVIQSAIKSGPQSITIRGKETAVILSEEDYRKLTKKRTWAKMDITIERSRDTGRNIDL